jgi:hypothetical protein
VNELPDDFFPISLHRGEEHLIAQHKKVLMGLPKQLHESREPCIQQYINNSTALCEKHLLQHFRIYDIDKLLQVLAKPESLLMAVSDGSHKNERGSFGVAVGNSEFDLYQIEGPAPYTEEITAPFRSEAYGFLANIKFLRLLIMIYNVRWQQPRKILVYCDNYLLIRRVHRLRYQTNSPRIYLLNDSDVMTQIMYEIQQLTTQHVILDCQHVKGHQDRHESYESLSQDAQLNVQAHNHAKNYSNNGKHINYDEFAHTPVTLYINSQAITDDYKKQIRSASRSQDI